MIIVGCDLSMNGSGLFKLFLNDTTLDVIDIDHLAFCMVKKYSSDKVLHFKKKDYANRFESNIWMESAISDFIDGADYIAIEDYAFGASGNTFDIGEFVGYIKTRAFINKHSIRLYDPNSIKKYATGKGNSDKISMYQAMLKELPALDSILMANNKAPGLFKDLPTPNKKSGCSPTSDIIDAYWIAQLLRLELLLRKGLIKLSTLDEKDISIFNRVTKANPTNLLDRDFLKK